MLKRIDKIRIIRPAMLIEDQRPWFKYDTHVISALIEKTRTLYFNCKLSRVDVDRVTLPVVKQLVNRKIWFMFRYQLKCGTVTGVTGDIIRIKEGIKKRRINIKNLQIYHESILSLLSLYQ